VVVELLPGTVVVVVRPGSLEPGSVAATVGGGIVVCEASVVVVLSPPSGGIVVMIEDVGLGLVVWALLVQPARITVKAIVAIAASFRAVVITPPGVSPGWSWPPCRYAFHRRG